MRPELRNRILDYNKAVAARRKKADDLDLIVASIMDLPYGQVKKVLTPEIMDVLAKYGYV